MLVLSGTLMIKAACTNAYRGKLISLSFYFNYCINRESKLKTGFNNCIRGKTIVPIKLNGTSGNPNFVPIRLNSSS
jgi:hypothetical protein